MGSNSLSGYTPENLWGSWEGARTESITAAFPLTFEADLPIKAWRKRNARAQRSLPNEVLADPIAAYWRTVDRSLAAVLPELPTHQEDRLPVLPTTYKPTYGMVMERHQQDGSTAAKYAEVGVHGPLRRRVGLTDVSSCPARLLSSLPHSHVSLCLMCFSWMSPFLRTGACTTRTSRARATACFTTRHCRRISCWASRRPTAITMAGLPSAASSTIGRTSLCLGQTP